MRKSVVLAIVFLLLPAFSAGAASSLHRKHPVHRSHKARPSEAAPKAPPVTRLPVAPDTFRA